MFESQTSWSAQRFQVPAAHPAELGESGVWAGPVPVVTSLFAGVSAGTATGAGWAWGAALAGLSYPAGGCAPVHSRPSLLLPDGACAEFLLDGFIPGPPLPGHKVRPIQ